MSLQKSTVGISLLSFASLLCILFCLGDVTDFLHTLQYSKEYKSLYNKEILALVLGTTMQQTLNTDSSSLTIIF